MTSPQRGRVVENQTFAPLPLCGLILPEHLFVCFLAKFVSKSRHLVLQKTPSEWQNHAPSSSAPTPSVQIMTTEFEHLYARVRAALLEGRRRSYQAVNFAIVETYWNIGRMIVEEEQGGKARADYGKQILSFLSARLTGEFGEGFNLTNLKYMRLVYVAFPIRHALRDELTWTHYRLLSKVENERARLFYRDEAIASQWSTRQLERQIHSFYYERYYEDRVRATDDYPTIGIILCSEKDAAVVKYSILEESRQLFASKYKLYLPAEEELARELKREMNEIWIEKKLLEEQK